MVNAIMKKFDVDKTTAEEYLEQLSNYGISNLDDLENTNVYICPKCGSAVVVEECETNQYWTNNGDRCVIHNCYYCGESLEDVDLEEGSKPLFE